MELSKKYDHILNIEDPEEVKTARVQRGEPTLPPMSLTADRSDELSPAGTFAVAERLGEVTMIESVQKQGYDAPRPERAFVVSAQELPPDLAADADRADLSAVVTPEEVEIIDKQAGLRIVATIVQH